MTVPLTPTLMVPGLTAADRNACNGTALPINLSNLECRSFPTRRSTPPRREPLGHRPRAQTNRLPFALPNEGPVSSANKPLPLSP
jgi:hypothetical protein